MQCENKLLCLGPQTWPQLIKVLALQLIKNRTVPAARYEATELLDFPLHLLPHPKLHHSTLLQNRTAFLKSRLLIIFLKNILNNTKILLIKSAGPIFLRSISIRIKNSLIGKKKKKYDKFKVFLTCSNLFQKNIFCVLNFLWVGDNVKKIILSDQILYNNIIIVYFILFWHINLFSDKFFAG